MATVLVVDDQESARALLGDELSQAGFEVAAAADGDEAWQRFCHRSPDVVVTDLQMPGCDGIELVRRIRQRSDVPVIVFSGHGSIKSSAHAFKAGADDFVSSLDVGVEDLVTLVREATKDPAGGVPDGSAPGSEDGLGDALEGRLAGGSQPARRARWQLAGLAPLRAPVLVSGEVGTGRATAIRALHELGTTKDGRFAVLECAGISAGDLAAELDSAAAVHLEDIEHLAWTAQSQLANRLAAEATGADGDAGRSGARVFASTAAPLPSLVRSGGFHPELGQALMRFHVELLPLRERAEDIGPIATVLLGRIGRSVGRERIQLSAAARTHLESGRFPENVRQLERLLERAAAYSPGRMIRRQTLEDLMVDLEESIASMRDERMLLERESLLRTLQETGGNITRTADILGRSRAAIYRLIEKHDIPLTRSG